MVSRREALRRFGVLGGVVATAPFFAARATASTPRALPPVPTATPPGFYRFKIGDFEAWALNDGELALPVDQSPYSSAPRDEMTETLRHAFLPTDQIRLGITMLLVRTKTDLVLVDTGCGPVFGPVGGRLAGNLAAAGIKPEQVTAVIITHLHGDHFGGMINHETGAASFPNARYIISRREYDFWMNDPDLRTSSLPAEMLAQFVQAAQNAARAVDSKWEKIAPGDRLLEGIDFIGAPGHTPGHILVSFTSGSEQLVNIADLVHHHAISFRHPAWPMGFDGDPKTGAETRHRLLDRFAAERSRVFGVHMPFTSLGHIRSTSGHFEYVNEPWRPI
jgi:glyoxylase-like metal-dependent hydrolase (beta-lactamase superfamily II)